MNINFRDLKDSLLHLLFPHTCEGCGVELPPNANLLCIRCLHSMPSTSFELFPGNPIEKRFYGRLPLQHAMAGYYFTKDSLMQHLIHQVKYKGNKELGLQLGQLLGDSLKRAGRFDADMMIPLPLFPIREKKRGYNQSALLCEGITKHLNIPFVQNALIRPAHTDTQTKKGRIDRWKNIEGKFLLTDPAVIAGKHILLVDDVITTGATLESCGEELLKAGNVLLSLAVLCYSTR